MRGFFFRRLDQLFKVPDNCFVHVYDVVRPRDEHTFPAAFGHRSIKSIFLMFKIATISVRATSMFRIPLDLISRPVLLPAGRFLLIPNVTLSGNQNLKFLFTISGLLSLVKGFPSFCIAFALILIYNCVLIWSR